MESEDVIMGQIMKLSKDRTVILISHRLANVQNADAIYVLDKGNVVESGTHKKLLDRNGTYAKLWNAQMSLENYGLEKEVTADEQ